MYVCSSIFFSLQDYCNKQLLYGRFYYIKKWLFSSENFFLWECQIIGVFTVRFGSVFIKKSNQTGIFLKKKKTETGSNRQVSVWFGLVFLEKKPVQTDLARFFRFGSVLARFGSVFSGLTWSFRFGSVLARFFRFDSVFFRFFRFGSVWFFQFQA